MEEVKQKVVENSEFDKGFLKGYEAAMEGIKIKDLRDQFAMAALATVSTIEFRDENDNLYVGDSLSQAIANYAYNVADAMLKARETKTENEDV